MADVQQSHEDAIDVVIIDGSEINNKDILAKLCIEAEEFDIEVRNCLRLYDLNCSTRQLKTIFNALKKCDIVNALKFLKVEDRNWNNYLKEACVHELICRIQNLLIDKCQFCSVNYMTSKDDTLLLQCSKCGQNVHKECLATLLGEKYNSGLTAQDVMDIVNPYKIDSFHFLCQRCSLSNIPQTTDGLKKSALPKSKSNDTSRSPPNLSHAADGDGEMHQSGASNNNTNSDTMINTPQSKHSNNIDRVNNDSTHKNTDENCNDNTKNKICRFYLKGFCKHGRKGAECLFKHPPYCQRLLSFGTHPTRGCNKGNDCEHIHPKMCFRSLSKRACFNDKCTFFHIKGTKRVRSERHNHHDYLKQPLTNEVSHTFYHNDQKSSSQNTDNSTQNDFLYAVNLLRRDLFQAMDNKLSTLLSNQSIRLDENYQSIPQSFSPTTYQNPSQLQPPLNPPPPHLINQFQAPDFSNQLQAPMSR